MLPEDVKLTDTRTISLQLGDPPPAHREGMTPPAHWMHYIGLVEETVDDPLPDAPLLRAGRRVL
jgi:hypothetical protein